MDITYKIIGGLVLLIVFLIGYIIYQQEQVGKLKGKVEQKKDEIKDKNKSNT